MLIDTHCHLFKEYYEDINEVLERAKENNVLKYVTAACDNNSIDEVLDLANNYECIYACVGIHPESCNEKIEHLEEMLKFGYKKIVAIGEIGLDYYYGKNNKDKQIEIFDKQLSLAEKYNLPVVIHSRDATFDTIDIIKKHNVRGIIHCFSGSIETAKIYLKMGFYIGVGGVLTFKNSNLKDIIKEIPLNRIVLETDSPYLSPVPFRGEKNEPKNIKVIAEFVAELKGEHVSKIIMETTKNAKDIFDF